MAILEDVVCGAVELYCSAEQKLLVYECRCNISTFCGIPCYQM